MKITQQPTITGSCPNIREYRIAVEQVERSLLDYLNPDRKDKFYNLTTAEETASTIIRYEQENGPLLSFGIAQLVARTKEQFGSEFSAKFPHLNEILTPTTRQLTNQIAHSNLPALSRIDWH